MTLSKPQLIGNDEYVLEITSPTGKVLFRVCADGRLISHGKTVATSHSLAKTLKNLSGKIKMSDTQVVYSHCVNCKALRDLRA